MVLTVDELDLMTELASKSFERVGRDDLLSRYYDGQQRLVQMGLAVPPELRNFEVVVNWPRVVVDTIVNRQDVRSLLSDESDEADDRLTDWWQANDLDSDLVLLNQDLGIYGRAFMCVGRREDDPSVPLITVESPREMTAKVDRRTKRLAAVLRQYDRDPLNAYQARARTLYLPDETIWAVLEGGQWVEVDRDRHELGRVPVVMFLNRRRTGEWWGRSEMADIIPLTDAAARSLTGLQLAQETLAVPQRYALGVSKGDFIDPATNKPLPVWEAYYGRLFASENEKASLGQLAGADLSNFHDTVRHYGQLASSVTGFPVKYFGIYTTNPAAEGAIRADEAQMVKQIERKNAQTGNAIAWALGIGERIVTGEWPSASKFAVLWHDPGTPTFAQRADALQKLAGGVPIISRQGAWDELGWSEARKDREARYFEEESASSAYLGLITEKDQADAGAEPAVDGA